MVKNFLAVYNGFLFFLLILFEKVNRQMLNLPWTQTKWVQYRQESKKIVLLVFSTPLNKLR